MNAKEEFLRHIGNNEVLCVELSIDNHKKSKVVNTFLTTGYTKEEREQFLIDINKDYDAGYGSQELYGTIWYKDGTWSTRGEYDGSEWWDYHCVPEIPVKLNRIDKVRDIKIDKILNKDEL